MAYAGIKATEPGSSSLKLAAMSAFFNLALLLVSTAVVAQELPITPEDRQALLAYSNGVRSAVMPTAADMLEWVSDRW